MNNVLIIESNKWIEEFALKLTTNFSEWFNISIQSWNCLSISSFMTHTIPDIVILDGEDASRNWVMCSMMFKQRAFKLVIINPPTNGFIKEQLNVFTDIFLPSYKSDVLLSTIIKLLFQLEKEKTQIKKELACSLIQMNTFTINKYSGEKVSLSDIIMFKADSNYSLLYTVNKTITLCKTLKEIESNISIHHPNLIRIHKSYIINKFFLFNISCSGNKKTITLKNGLELEISRRRWQNLNTILRNNPQVL